MSCTDTRPGQWFDAAIQTLIVISLISFALETLPDLSWRLQAVLRVVEMTTIGIFTVEYLSRLYVADRKLKFAFSFFGMVDLLAILPF
ncbi:MAG: ion transporter [bacterium]|nr:ion transporter [bacterium]